MRVCSFATTECREKCNSAKPHDCHGVSWYCVTRGLDVVCDPVKPVIYGPGLIPQVHPKQLSFEDARLKALELAQAAERDRKIAADEDARRSDFDSAGRQALREAMASATLEVETWPEWKRNALGSFLNVPTAVDWKRIQQERGKA